MKISIGTDHAGFPVKQEIAAHLRELGHDCISRLDERKLLVFELWHSPRCTRIKTAHQLLLITGN